MVEHPVSTFPLPAFSKLLLIQGLAHFTTKTTKAEIGIPRWPGRSRPDLRPGRVHNGLATANCKGDVRAGKSVQVAVTQGNTGMQTRKPQQTLSKVSGQNWPLL